VICLEFGSKVFRAFFMVRGGGLLPVGGAVARFTSDPPAAINRLLRSALETTFCPLLSFTPPAGGRALAVFRAGCFGWRAGRGPFRAAALVLRAS